MSRTETPPRSGLRYRRAEIVVPRKVSLALQAAGHSLRVSRDRGH